MGAPNCRTECTLLKLHSIRRRSRQAGGKVREREVLSVIGLVLRRGRSRDLFLNFLHCSMCLCLCVLVTKQRKTLIQCLAKGTEGDLEKKKGVVGGGLLEDEWPRR